MKLASKYFQLYYCERSISMRINPHLTEAADRNPTKQSRQISLNDLCVAIDNRKLTLPLYQRDLSWTKDKYVQLLNYELLSKAPVSAISINVINNVDIAVPQVSFIDRELLETSSGQNSVVDGQQRITTHYLAYTNHESISDIVLDLSKGRFLTIDSSALPKRYQIPVGILLNKSDQAIFDYAISHKALLDAKVSMILIQIRTKFKNYYYTINEATDLTEAEQIQWFEVLNNAGSRVTANQMAISKLKIYDIDFYKDYIHVFDEKLKAYGFEDLFNSQPTYNTYPICALNPAYEKVTDSVHSNNFCPMASDTKIKSICNLEPEKIKELFPVTLSALDSTLKFIDDNKLPNPKRIEYINYLLGYFVFHGLNSGEANKDFLINWYNSVDFANLSNTARRQIFTNLINNVGNPNLND